MHDSAGYDAEVAASTVDASSGRSTAICSHMHEATHAGQDLAV
jgi:hypothetical protein